MLGNKLYAKFESFFQDYLFNFEQKNLHTSILSGNVNMNNVNIRPDKINEIFKKKNLPIALKAGLISKLNVKVIPLGLKPKFIVQYPQFIFRLSQDHHRRCVVYCGSNQCSFVKGICKIDLGALT
jgi:hypothetical protein